MFVLSDRSADLFILYPPGARGDFLAAILKDQLHWQYKNYVINPPENYQKTHWNRDITVSQIPQFTHKIRIRLSSIEEYLTVTYLWQQKITNDAWSVIVEQLIQNENHIINQKSIDKEFDYIVDFKNLYSTDYIKDLYQKINHRELSGDAVKEIQYNIDLHPWVTLPDYKL